MKYRLEKNMRIIDELVGFCYKKGGHKINVSMDYEKTCTYIEINAEIKNLDKKDIDYLEEVLNHKRQHEVEQCYWVANGEVNLGEELMLVGVMIDNIKIKYEDSVLSINITRLE